MLSIEVWERLTIEHGWSQEQYIERLQQAIKQVLIQGPEE